ncbi:MAG: hypothetical protein RJA22_1474 [Verrucomicrobiota bacterium]
MKDAMDMSATDKNTLFARPNLKAFLFGAVALLVVQHLISDAHSQGTSLFRPVPVQARSLSESDLQELVWRANEKPNYEAYLHISQCYEARGEYRKAIQFLRRAEKFSAPEHLD